MSAPYLGDFPVNGGVFFLWNTNGQDGASITRSTDGTLKIYKDGSTTERTSLNGVTQTEDFDSATGVHSVAIDTSDNTDAGFYAAGHEYAVVMTGMTIDTKTVNAVIAHFSIERAGGALALLKNATYGLSALHDDLPAAAPSAAAIATEILDHDVTDHTAADTVGKLLNDAKADTTAILEDTGTTLDGIVDAIKVTTDKLDTAMEADAAVYRFTANALEEGPTSGAVPSAADVADAVWDEVIAVAHVGPGSAGKLLSDVEAVAGGTDWTSGEKEQIRSALGVDGDKTAATAGQLQTVAGTVAKVETMLEADGGVSRFTANALEEGPVDGAAPAASAIADAVWEEALADHSGTAGSTAEQIANIATGSPPTAAAIRAEIDANSTQLAAILVDTGTDIPASITALGSPMQAGAETTIADGVLLRHTEDIEASAGDDTLAYAIMRSTNRTHRNVNVLETYRRDGVTLHAYQQLTPDPTGQPVSDISGAEAV